MFLRVAACTRARGVNGECREVGGRGLLPRVHHLETGGGPERAWTEGGREVMWRGEARVASPRWGNTQAGPIPELSRAAFEERRNVGTIIHTYGRDLFLFECGVYVLCLCGEGCGGGELCVQAGRSVGRSPADGAKR